MIIMRYSNLNILIILGGINMNEMIILNLINLYEAEIKEVEGTISNEHLCELGYYGDEPNTHTNNILNLLEYISILKEKIAELQ